jgi:hypothetical protein
VVYGGPRTDWLRNIEANGSAEVTAGRHTFAAGYRRLSVAKATEVFAVYERRNRMIGWVVRRGCRGCSAGATTARRRHGSAWPSSSR